MPNQDILDDYISKYNIIAHRDKNIKMIYGSIWEFAIGTYGNYQLINNTEFKNTGLDIINKTKKQVIELKNRTNTCNSGSKKAVIDNLTAFKKEHPEYTCIYACVNENTNDKTKIGYISEVNKYVQMYTGMKLLKEIFNDDVDQVLNVIRTAIKKHIEG